MSLNIAEDSRYRLVIVCFDRQSEGITDSRSDLLDQRIEEFGFARDECDRVAFIQGELATVQDNLSRCALA